MIRKVLKKVSLVAGLIVALVAVGQSKPVNSLSGSEFNAGRIIDDAVFFNSNSMSVGEIQNFLSSKVDCDFDGSEMVGGITRAQYAAQRGYPTTFTCLPQYKENPSTRVNNIGSPHSTPAGAISAAQIIYNASATYGVSSKALIVLLQKEQGLVTDEWPVPRQYQIATGYGCPDTAPCDEQYYGFSNQVNKAAYQFKRYVDNAPNYRYRAGQVNSIYWSPTTSCGASDVFIENGATAALYNYTPYRPNVAALNNLYGTGDGCSAYGNRNFWRYFRDWFGATTGVDYGTSSCEGDNTSFPRNRRVLIGNSLRGYSTDRMVWSAAAGTGSGCSELHRWTFDLQRWDLNIGTPMSSFNPAYGKLVMADYDGDGKDDNIVVLFQNTGSGKVEIHVMNDNLIGWKAHIATNHPTVNQARADVIFGDRNGDRKDEGYLVLYNATGSGKIEVHQWSSNFQSWAANIATNHPAIAEGTGRAMITMGDWNGDGLDDPKLVLYNGTGSGKIEVHEWELDFQSWFTHIATNATAADPSRVDVVFGDRNGDKRDEGYLVLYNLTGSGKIEVHEWNPGFRTWRTNIATNVSV